MSLVQGALLTGAAATGVVVVERIRHRGSGDAVRLDVTEIGTTVAEHVGKAAGFVGRTSGEVLGHAARLADSLGDRTSQIVSDAGRAVARGAGATLGAYAGAIDRVTPRFGGDTDAQPEQPQRALKTAKPKPSKPTATRRRTARATAA